MPARAAPDERSTTSRDLLRQAVGKVSPESTLTALRP